MWALAASSAFCAAAGAGELDFDVHQAELLSDGRSAPTDRPTERVVSSLSESNCMSYAGQMEKQNQRVCVIS
jgi:hypothetical protein